MKLSSLAQLPLSLLPSYLQSSLPPSRAIYPSVPIPISYLFNNVAAGINGDFDAHQKSFPVEALPTGDWVWDGIHYSLPASWDSRPDNVISQSQVLNLTGSGHLKELHILYSGDWIDGETTERFYVVYEDGYEQEIQLTVKNWWNLHWLNEGVIKAPYHHDGSSVSYNLTQIHQFSAPLLSRSPIVNISFPSTSYSWNRLHIFALSYTPAFPPDEPQAVKDLVVRRARLTSKTQTDAPFAPLLEIALSSLAASWQNASFPITTPHTLSLASRHFRQVETSTVYRLAAGDEVRLLVPVLWEDEARDQYEVLLPIEVVMRDERGREVGRWAVNVERRFDREMETPVWWDHAKFGIFIHWGVYSVPAWAPHGYYAAWYNLFLHNQPNAGGEVWRYHRETYGEDVVYDDFIANWTGIHFNATEWVDLFQDAGAKYFVLTTKHHEGIALFDTQNTSHRSSVHLGPKRDYLRELMDAASHTSLRKGTYFSMPEWFNPDYAKYGIEGYPGGPARNPFKPDVFENYTGRLEIEDYLWDLQLAQMRILAQEYKSEIMWCDIGGPNLTYVFAPEFYAQAKREGRQVTMNNRCGSHASFDTPEFARFSSIHTRSWESSEGIDPHTYGYNRRTLAKNYRSPTTIVRTLVDIVSKNGNYLLNIGPDHEGRIIDPMKERLIEVGKWLNHSGECVYGTTYSSLGAEYGSLRFTTTPTTFCIISLDRPESKNLIVPSVRQVPILPGDTVTLLGPTEVAVNWTMTDEGLVLHLNRTAVDEIDHAWAFKIRYSWHGRGSSTAVIPS